MGGFVGNFPLYQGGPISGEFEFFTAYGAKGLVVGITATGAGTYRIPQGVRNLAALMAVGAGGGGGSGGAYRVNTTTGLGWQAGGGGSGGGLVSATNLPVIPGSTIDYTIGAKGTGGNIAGAMSTGTTVVSTSPNLGTSGGSTLVAVPCVGSTLVFTLGGGTRGGVGVSGSGGATSTTALAAAGTATQTGATPTGSAITLTTGGTGGLAAARDGDPAAVDATDGSNPNTSGVQNGGSAGTDGSGGVIAYTAGGAGPTGFCGGGGAGASFIVDTSVSPVVFSGDDATGGFSGGGGGGAAVFGDNVTVTGGSGGNAGANTGAGGGGGGSAVAWSHTSSIRAIMGTGGNGADGYLLLVFL